MYGYKAYVYEFNANCRNVSGILNSIFASSNSLYNNVKHALKRVTNFEPMRYSIKSVHRGSFTYVNTCGIINQLSLLSDTKFKSRMVVELLLNASIIPSIFDSMDIMSHSFNISTLFVKSKIDMVLIFKYFSFLTNNNANDPAERMRITSNGSVNIGGDYTQTTYILNVTGSSNFTSTLHAANGSAGAPSITNTGNTDTGMWFPAADVVGFSTSGVERMRVKANGQIRFIPLASAPGSPELGDVYYDSVTNKLRVYAKVAGTDQWVDLH